MKDLQFGILGLGVMGRNLALNVAEKGFSVAAFDLWPSACETMAKEAAAEAEEFHNGQKNAQPISCAKSVEEFTESLTTPRRILLMVKAGEVVDKTIDLLLPHLSKGDILIDGGNSFYQDTAARSKRLAEQGIHFFGTGVSGGQEGARTGPAIMPGGDREAYEAVRPIFEAISAHVGEDPCCCYIGPDGAGHYVKMVHNGIEYADMQLICEAYDILRGVGGLSVGELGDVFAEWNKGELDSYLIEITRDVLRKKDEETGKPMVDVILDCAGQKGTGKWTSQSALDLGLPAPTIAEAVFARCLSAIKEERVEASGLLAGPPKSFDGDKKALIESVRRALYMSKICCYAQGFALMDAAAKEYGWELDYGSIAAIFRGGCIIRAQFLNKITEAYRRSPGLKNLMLDEYFRSVTSQYHPALREVVALAVTNGLPAPAFSSAMAYYDGYRCAVLPANLLQAQRDYFGAHTFERVDKEGSFSIKW